MNPTSTPQNLLREILAHLHQHKVFPTRAAFRVTHENAWDLLDALANQGFLNAATTYYILTPKGLRACDSKDARSELEACNIVLSRLQAIYRQDALSGNPHRERTVAELWPFISQTPESKKYYTQTSLSITLMFLAMDWLASSKTIALFDYERETQGTVTKVRLYEEILKVRSIPTKAEKIDAIIVTPRMQELIRATKEVLQEVKDLEFKYFNRRELTAENFQKKHAELSQQQDEYLARWNELCRAQGAEYPPLMPQDWPSPLEEAPMPQDEPKEKRPISMPRLSAINIQRFKAAFEPGVVKLLPFTVLIGKNGSGKSTLIEALQWIDATLRQDAVNACGRYFGVHDLINLRSRGLRPFFAINLEWALEKKKLNYEVRVEEDDDHTTPRIATEELSTGTQKGRKIVMSGPESSDRLALRRAAGSPAENLQEFWRYAVFLRLSPNRMAEGSLPRRTSTAPLLDEEGQNLPALLNELNNEQRADLIDAVKSVLPHMEDVTVSKPSAGRSERVHYSLHERMPTQEKSSSIPIPAWMLSEGTRRLTAIFALLSHNPPPSLLCIEEVENGLDPWAVKILLNHLQSAADKGTQVLITTHSPWLLDHVPPETIIQANRVNGDTKYEIFSDRKAIKAYASSVPAGTRYVQDDE